MAEENSGDVRMLNNKSSFVCPPPLPFFWWVFMSPFDILFLFN